MTKHIKSPYLHMFCACDAKAVFKLANKCRIAAVMQHKGRWWGNNNKWTGKDILFSLLANTHSHTQLPDSLCKVMWGRWWLDRRYMPAYFKPVRRLITQLCFARGCEVCWDMCSRGGMMWEVRIDMHVFVTHVHRWNCPYFMCVLCRLVLSSAVVNKVPVSFHHLFLLGRCFV